MNNAIQYPGPVGERLPDPPAPQPEKRKKRRSSTMSADFWICRFFF